MSIGTPAIAQKLLRRLAGLDEQAGQQHSSLMDVQLATAELAGNAALEWPAIPATLIQELAQRLTKMIKTSSIMNQTQPILRVALGNTLARLGDPRPGVIDIDRMQFCYIPPGPFWMGDSKESHPNSSLIYGYWVARYPLTTAHFRTFVEASGHEPADRDSLRGIANHPVVRVSWHDALACCRWLTERWQQKGWLPSDWQVTLPSEIEWEKAARGGLEIPSQPLKARPDRLHEPDHLSLMANPASQRRFPWGDDIDSKRVNYVDTKIGATNPIGCFPEGGGPYECQEMSGNIWEWTRSHYEAYSYNPQKRWEDLTASDDILRVLRGGAFLSNGVSVRCASRSGDNPSKGYGDLGFRLVVSPV